MKKLSVACATLAVVATAAYSQSVTVLDFNISNPFIEVYNDRIGNSRFFNGPNTDRVRASVFVAPSPDTDAFPVEFQGSFFQSLNGGQTSVSVTHSSMGSLPNPSSLTFVGLTSGRGGGRNEFTRAFDRADPAVVPLLNDWDSAPFVATITNPLARDGITSRTFDAPDFEKDTLPAFVTDLSVTGGGLNPRLDWKIPVSGVAPTSASIQIRRIDEESADRTRITRATLVHVKTLPADATSYTINERFSFASQPGFPEGLEIGKRYEISVQLDVVAASGVTKGRSRTFFEFAPLSSGTSNVAVFLPSIGPDGIFKFDVTVDATSTIVIDPDVAVGYIYQVGFGNPNFRSVSLPNIGDGQFIVEAFDPSLGKYRAGFVAFAERTYDFVGLGFASGVPKFRVKGIEASAGLDPRNPTAFLTTVGFTGAGRFTGSMVPITSYSFSGFLPPINVPPTVNTGRAGSSFPLKWTLADVQGATVSDLGAVESITFKPSECAPFSTDPAGASAALASGGSRLRYDPSAQQYVFNWKSPSAPGCYVLFLTLDTEQVFSANVMLTK